MFIAGISTSILGCVLLFLTYGSIKIRNVPSAFNDSRYLGMFVYNTVLTVLIALPIDFAVDDMDTTIIFRTFGVALGPTVSLTLLYVPRLIKVMGMDPGMAFRSVCCVILFLVYFVFALLWFGFVWFGLVWFCLV